MKLLSKLLLKSNGDARWLPQQLFKAKQSLSIRPFQRFALMGRGPLTGAEVGVYKGENALHMLRHLEIERLFLVDPYTPYSDYDAVEMIDAKECARARLSKFPNATFVYEPSLIAAANLPELDFVYIDGAHDYESVKQDIAAWWPKIRPMGFLGGHDFIHVHEPVIRAVVEFAFSSNLVLRVESPDWWIEKP